MTNHKIPAYSLIFNYLLECTNITFKTSQYIAGQSIPGLNLGLSTVKKIRAGKEMSETSANKIANTFSLKLWHPEERRILRDDLDLSLDAFKKIFPPGAFIQEHSDADYVNMSLFTNKLYRGYYITPNSPHSVYMAYFKLFEKNGSYSAYMVRGIQDLEDMKWIKNYINEEPEQLNRAIQENYYNNKRIEGIHVYKAENSTSKGRQDITFTKRCIKIDFHSIEDNPCYCTMFWNTYMANFLKVNSYIGGSSLIVDTNDSKRGKSICAFKMGLEAMEAIPADQREIIEKGPLLKNSPRVVSEMSLESVDGIITLDDSDDNRFYHFIQEDRYRALTEPKYEDVDVESLVTSLFKLKADYERELDDLKRYVHNIKNETRI